MGRAFPDDLRRRIDAGSEHGEGSCRVLAQRFGVNWEYVRKVRQHQKKYGQIARRPLSHYGVPSRMTESAKARTKEALDQAITEALRLITHQDAKAWLRLTLNWVQLSE